MIEDLVYQVHLFNKYAGGKLSEGGNKRLEDQVRVVREEANELFEAIIADKCSDPENVLKEAVDCLVTVFGIVEMLEARGYNVYSAWRAVNENNLSKFYMTDEEAMLSVKHYQEQDMYVTKTRLGEDKYVLKDINNKVRKPITYQTVDLKQYLPKEEK